MARRVDLIQVVIADMEEFPAHRIVQGVHAGVAPVAVEVEFGEGGAGRAGAVGRITEHPHPGRLLLQQGQPDDGFVVIRATGFGQSAVGDDPGIGFDRDVGLETVLAPMHRLMSVPGLRIHGGDDAILGDFLGDAPLPVGAIRANGEHRAAIQPGDTGSGGKGKLFVRTLTMADSEDILKAYKDYVVWNDDLQLYYLELPLTTGTVKIWFEDEKSLKAKAGLVQTYGLGGAAFWRKGFEPAHFWQRFAKHELT